MMKRGILIVTIILGLLLAGLAIAANDDECRELVFGQVRMSQWMIEHLGVDYKSDNAHVVSIRGEWYLVTWEEVPCALAATTPAEPLPEGGNECLGIPYAGEGYFTVDGIEYWFDGNLSFIVPKDLYWRWELRINGNVLLVFEQSEDATCHVIEDYRNE